MRFRVSQELRQSVGSEFSMELRQHSLFLDDDAALSDLQGRALLLRTDRGLLTTVSARAFIQGTCSRCLAAVQSPIQIDFQEEFIPVVDPVSGAHISAAEAEDSFIIDADLMMDLGEALRQYALMSSPTKPLCRPHCAGLCPTCGANLNERRCSCRSSSDERWRALSTLKSENREGS
jgi:uncharacterized protein